MRQIAGKTAKRLAVLGGVLGLSLALTGAGAAASTGDNAPAAIGDTFPTCEVSGGQVHWDAYGYATFSGTMVGELYYYVPGVTSPQILDTASTGGTFNDNHWDYYINDRSAPTSDATTTYYVKTWVEDDPRLVGTHTTTCSE